MANITAFFYPKQWYPSTDRPLQTRPLFLLNVQAVLILATMMPRRARIAIGIAGLPLLWKYTTESTSGDRMKDLGRGLFVSLFILKWIDFGMLVKDGQVYKVAERALASAEVEGYVKDDESVSATSNRETRSLQEKFRYSMELWLFTMRGTNWNWEVGGIPPVPPQTKRYFLFRTTIRLIASYLTFELCKLSMGLFSYIRTQPRESFFAIPISHQVILTWLHQLEAFCWLNLPYQLGALITVLLKYQNPSDWPPLFGNLSDCYLVSRGWGRAWHQLLRRPLSILTPYAQRWLGAKSRGANRTISLFSSFCMSGLVHWSAALNSPWTPVSYGMFTYFIMQAPAIRLEDLVVDWGRRRGIKGNRLLRCLGYLWTFGWISFSMRYAARYQYEHGALSVYKPQRFSLIGFVVG